MPIKERKRPKVSFKMMTHADPDYTPMEGEEESASGYMGITCLVTIETPFKDGEGKQCWSISSFETPGLWGIEADCTLKHQKETFNDEIKIAKDILNALVRYGYEVV